MERLSQLSIPSMKGWSSGEAVNLEEEILINHNWDILRRTMWNYVGIVRNTKRLTLAKERLSDMLREIEQHYLDYLITPNLIELRNISLVANMIIEAALKREESRGLHYTTDFPTMDNNSLHWNIFQRDTTMKNSRVNCVEKRSVG